MNTRGIISLLQKKNAIQGLNNSMMKDSAWRSTWKRDWFLLGL